MDPLFVICLIIVLCQIIEYITTLKEEIIYTIQKYFNSNTKEIREDFILD